MRERRPVVSTGSPGHPALHILLLGPPAVHWHGRPVTLARRQSRAVLFRVAAATQPVPRDLLCFLLWPDEPDYAARRNLTNVLTHLKRALPLPDVVLVDRDNIRLNAAIASSDVQMFAAATEAVRTHGGSAQLQTVLDLYRGAFLDGFTLPDCPEFDVWRDTERHVWERRFLNTLAMGVEVETAVHNAPAAIAAAQRYLDLNPLAEAMHQQLMVLFAATGDRTAAIRQFERCVAALHRVLGVDPLPATRAVYEAIRDGRHSWAAGLQRTPGPLFPPAVGQSEPRTRVLDEQTTQQVGQPVPAPVTSLIGRDAEVDTACALLAGSTSRLVSLTGPGGVGKTRLAVAAGIVLRDRFADGVVWVPLASLRDPARLADAIVQACGVQQGMQPSRYQLLDYVRDRALLLILDNFEHVLPAAPLLADLLAAGSRLHLLVTSRTALNLPVEVALPVVPLPLPPVEPLPPLDVLAAQPAVALLLDRARQSAPTLALSEATAADLAAICARLDGLPLALELAAARLRVLAPRQLLARLDACLPLLSGGSRDLPARQRTIRATIDWSYQLLKPSEQVLFARLAVFASGCTLEAVEALCVGDGDTPIDALGALESLVGQSLVQSVANVDGEPRFTMLETIREYGAERLAAQSDAARVWEQYASYFLTLAEQAEPELIGPNQAKWLARLAVEHDNLRTVLDRSLKRHDMEQGARVASAMWRFWVMDGNVLEGNRWLHEFLTDQDATAALSLAVHAKALHAAGNLLTYQGDDYGARKRYEASLVLRRQLGDKLGIAGLLSNLAVMAHNHGDFATARALNEESLVVRRELGDTWGVSVCLGNLGLEAMLRGEYEAATALMQESHALQRALGDRQIIGISLNNLGNLALARADPVAANAYHAESLTLRRELGDKAGICDCLEGLAAASTDLRRPERAARLFGAAAGLREALGIPLPAFEQVIHTRLRATRDLLDEADWDIAWAAGRAMSLEEALGYAVATGA